MIPFRNFPRSEGFSVNRISFSVIGFCGCIAGLLSLSFGNGSLIKIGGVTLHALISEEYGYNIKSITAALSGWMIICAGKAVLSKFAEVYFKNELKAETPFTLVGAKGLLLGILTLAIPTGCAVAGSIVEGIIAGFMQVERRKLWIYILITQQALRWESCLFSVLCCAVMVRN